MIVGVRVKIPQANSDGSIENLLTFDVPGKVVGSEVSSETTLMDKREPRWGTLGDYVKKLPGPVDNIAVSVVGCHDLLWIIGKGIRVERYGVIEDAEAALDDR